MRHLVLALCCLASPAFAACPPPPAIQAEADAILARIQASPDQRSARVLSNELWRLWAKAPDVKAQGLLDEGMARRESYDFNGAIDRFDELIAYCPDYAEGYNQKAFANFLRGDYEAALKDLDLALERSPRHVAAMAGKALTLLGMGRTDDGQLVLREALELNPWLSERQFLIEPEGEEL